VLKFTVDGKDMNIEGTLNLLSDQDRATREKARVNWHGCLVNVGLFARVHNTLAKEKRLRIAGVACHPSQRAATYNHVLTQVVEALRNAVADTRASSHRYHQGQMDGALRRCSLGPQRLSMDQDRTISWAGSRKLRWTPTRPDPRMADIAKSIFSPMAGLQASKMVALGVSFIQTVTTVHPYA
jgi:oligoendopeptidase F